MSAPHCPVALEPPSSWWARAHVAPKGSPAASGGLWDWEEMEPRIPWGRGWASGLGAPTLGKRFHLPLPEISKPRLESWQCSGQKQQLRIFASLPDLLGKTRLAARCKSLSRMPPLPSSPGANTLLDQAWLQIPGTASPLAQALKRSLAWEGSRSRARGYIAPDRNPGQKEPLLLHKPVNKLRVHLQRERMY